MNRFDSYFLMNEADAIQYVQYKMAGCEALAFLNKGTAWQASEIGDGNLNYVFRVSNGQASVILKQAGPTLRISSEMHISTDRNRIESEILLLQGKYAPGLVPQVYDYDTTLCACLMEDLQGYTLMRTALMAHQTFPHFAGQVSTFMVDTLLPTTDLVMDPLKKKHLQQKYVNPELCEITEDLVYTEPYNDQKGRNNVFPPNAEFVRSALYQDDALHLEVAKLFLDFLTNTQALIHGDLHTGSIFINAESTKVFDPEFAFYGPMGYDIGNVIANLIFAWCNGEATLSPGAKKSAFLSWVESAIRDTVDLTFSKMDTYLTQHTAGPMAQTPGFRQWYIAGVRADTSGVTGLELNRRIVGMANVKDITTIPDPAARTRAERICITAAKEFILSRHQVATGADYLSVLGRAVAQHS